MIFPHAQHLVYKTPFKVSSISLGEITNIRNIDDRSVRLIPMYPFQELYLWGYNNCILYFVNKLYIGIIPFNLRCVISDLELRSFSHQVDSKKKDYLEMNDTVHGVRVGRY